MPKYGLKKKGNKHKTLKNEDHIVAKPYVLELDSCLLPALNKSSIPDAVSAALPNPEYFNLQCYFPTQEHLRHENEGIDPFVGRQTCWLGSTNIEKIEHEN